MGAFWLRKWYLDAVSEDARVWIVYCADLRLGPLRVRCESVLESARGSPVRTRTRMGGEEPVEAGGVISWSSRSLGVGGRWKAECAGVKRTLLESEEGSVVWDCRVPRAEAVLRTEAGTVRARGYAEVMEMTIPPWKLPISELRWGRAVGESGSAVWIDWRGERPLTRVFFDDREVPGATVCDDEVKVPGFDVKLASERVLRDGPIGTTALAAIPGIESWAPAALLAAHETKRLGRASCGAPLTGEVWSGWAVYEVVRFQGRGA